MASINVHALQRSRRREAAGWFRPVAVALLMPPVAAAIALLFALGPPMFAQTLESSIREAGVPPAELPRVGPLDKGVPQSAVLRARDGTVLAEINDQNFGRRKAVPLSEVSKHMIAATLAAEDRRFFGHGGVDLTGMARALAQTLQSDETPSGASTIEMQLARNLFMPDERTDQTLSRKLREASTAIQLDKRFTKPEILEAYLNVVYYGAMAHGVEAAAQTYFGKSARDLDLAESSLLAGLPQSPTVLNPFTNFEGARQRQWYVLEQLAENRVITLGEAEEAWSRYPPLVEPGATPRLAPHFVDYVQQYARRHWGPEELYLNGLDVTTTIDLEIQELAERIVAGHEGVRRQARANNTAMVVLDRETSQVLAMVGSKNFNDASIDGQVNVALAGRQPGSSIKPLVYLTAFERGLNPSVQVTDEITPFSAPPGQPPYVPANYEDKYYGLVTLRDALGNSLNVPAVKTLKFVGVPAFVDVARRLGVTTLNDWDPGWLSLTLGGGEVRLLELTGAYATISRLGVHRAVEPIVRAADGRGAVLQDAARDAGAQVVDPRMAYQLLHIMGDTGARGVTFGPSSPLNLPRPHMVKTGTTDDFRDTWTIGCIPRVCVGVWMGNTQNWPMQRVSSSLTAGRIWVDTMNALISRYGWPPEEFERPAGVITKRVQNVSGARPGAADYEGVFLPGNEEPFRLQMDWIQPN
jgi:penicillin-binding protein 1C